MTTKSVLRFGALGAAVSFLTLVAQAAIVAPIDFVEPLDVTVAGVGSGLVVVPVIGTYVPALASMSILWWFLWFFCVSLLLWRRSGECPEVTQ